MKELFNTKNLMIVIFITFVTSILYIVMRIILAPSIAPLSENTTRVKGDYVLMLVQCVLGVLAMSVPSLLKRKFSISVPSKMLIMYAVFLYCAIYLGEVRNFYYKIPHWDTILHAFSGAALGALGFFLISLLNRTKSIYFSLSPLFVSLFSFSFSIALGVIWEVYEFSVDFFLHTNMQKYALETGELLVGQVGLLDTMKDLIVDAAGALVMSAIGYITLKDKRDR